MSCDEFIHYLKAQIRSDIFQNEFSSSPGGGHSTIFCIGRLRPEVQPFTLLNTIFDRKGTPFVYLPLKNGTPFTYHTALHSFSKPLEGSLLVVFF